MLRLLSERETGQSEPLFLRRAETTRRYFNLALSKYRDVEGIHKGSINSVDIDTVENRYLLSGGSHSTIAIHDLQTTNNGMVQTYKHVCQTSDSSNCKYSVDTVQWYPIDTGMFTTSGADHKLKIWDTNTMKVADHYTFKSRVCDHHMSSIARKHCLIAVGCEQSTVKLVDMKSGAATHQLKGHTGSVVAVRWSPRHEFLLATGSADSKVLLWDIRTAKGSLLALDQHNRRVSSKSGDAKTAHDGTVNGLQFTSDGLFIVTFGTDDRLRLWNASTGRNMLVNFGTVFNSSKRSLKFAISGDGCPDVLFIPSEGNIQVLDLYQGTHLNTLHGHYNSVNCCALQKETHYLFSGGADRNILVWIPTSETEDYEEHLKDQSRECHSEGSVRKEMTATVDTWSSDEDGA